MTKTERIGFYRERDEHGYMSNFAKYPIVIEGREWPTTEHYFQAMKFEGTPHEELIRAANSASTAAHMGRERSRPLRKDWEQIKDDVMRVALEAKFTQHPELAAQLLATGDAELVEVTRGDYYWGCGTDGSGKNMLGILLVELRAKLRSVGT